MQKVNNIDIFVTKWKLIVPKRKITSSSQTQEIHYSEEKSSYKAVVLTYLWCSSRTFNFDMYLYLNISQSNLLSEEFFNGLL
jgi:hypothetical protein